MALTLFHHSFAISDLAVARKFYGEMLQCPEGRKLPGRADFNFFGHHIVAHLAPEEVVGNKGKKIGGTLATPSLINKNALPHIADSASNNIQSLALRDDMTTSGNQ